MYNFGDFSKETLEQLSSKGVFLTVKNGEKVNTMTIGWGSLSQYWGKEIFIVPVRKSRYTFELLENTDEFTVSVPLGGKADGELKYCGTVSGRDENKAEKLAFAPAREINTPVIDGCDIFYECKILTYSDLENEKLPEELRDKWYATGDMHRLYFAEIITAYRK